jgi:hypothetical protein
MKVELRINGADRLRVKWERAGRRAAKIAKDLLYATATRVRTHARNTLVEIGKEAERKREMADKAFAEAAGEDYTPQTRSSRTQIASTLWEKQVGTRSRNVAQVLLGWGKKYGPVLEWGPLTATSGWWITPGKTSPFLRWYDFGAKKVMYSRTPVWHSWDKTQLRPHFAPAYDSVWPGFLAAVERIPEQVL